MRPSHGREWCRPSADKAWPTAHGLCSGTPAAPTPGCRWARSRRHRRPRGPPARRSGSARCPRVASIAEPMPVKNSRSQKLIWNRSVVAASTRPSTRSGAGARPAGPRSSPSSSRRHCPLDAEHVQQGDHVVGAVDQRELLALDALAVPAQVQGDHAVAPRERLDRREPRQQSGAAQRVQQHDRRRLRVRAGRVGDVRRPARVAADAGSSTSSPGRNPGPRHVHLVAQQRERIHAVVVLPGSW